MTGSRSNASSRASPKRSITVAAAASSPSSRDGDPAPGVLGAFPECNQAHEHPPNCGLLGPDAAAWSSSPRRAERAGQPAELDVAVAQDQRRGAPLEQLGERVLEQRQGAGLVDDSATMRATSPGSNVDPAPGGRLDDRPFQLVGGEWGDGDGALFERARRNRGMRSGRS